MVGRAALFCSREMRPLSAMAVRNTANARTEWAKKPAYLIRLVQSSLKALNF